MFDALFRQKLFIPENQEYSAPGTVILYNKRISSRNFHIKGFIVMLISIVIGLIMSSRQSGVGDFSLLYIPAYYANGLVVVFFVVSFFGTLLKTRSILLAGFGFFVAAKAFDWFDRSINNAKWFQTLSTKTFITGDGNWGVAVAYYGMFFFQFFVHSFFLLYSLKKIKDVLPLAMKDYDEYTHNGKYREEQHETVNHYYNYTYSQYENFKQERDSTQQQYSQTNSYSNNKNDNTINFFSGCETKEDVERRYKKLAQLYHPDTGMGDVETMKIINNQKEDILNKA